MLKNKFNQKITSILSLTALASVLIVSTDTQLNTSAAFTDKIPAKITVESDTLKPPTNLKIVNARVGETDLTWTPSITSYVTGYKILRSQNNYGPWAEIGTVSGRTSKAYIDKTSGATMWFYRAESIGPSNWSSTSPGYEAPPAVGRYFYDGFEGPEGNLDGRVTEDGKSKWLVWSGDMSTADSKTPGGNAAYGTPGFGPSPNSGDVAVVRTPVTDAWVFASDFDGLERFVLRGKDPLNYIYVGGGGGVATFQIGVVKNGVKEVLTSLAPGSDKDFRLEIKGNTITAYIDAVQNDPKSGTLYTTMTSTKFDMGADATYFGIGFTRGGYGINDFTFEAL